jgi:putative addiction module CopG family antidote
MNVYLGEHYEEFLRKKLAEGRFTSVSEVIRDALRVYEQQSYDEYVHKLVAEAIDDVVNGRVHEATPEFWEELDRDIDSAIKLDLPIPDHVKY